MNEQEHSSQLSALFDGELPAVQAELVIRRAMKDPQLRATWGRYALIGAAIRSEPLAVRTQLRDDVAARVSARLSADPAGLAADGSAAGRGKSRDARSQFARGAWGMAIAASVAAVSLLVLRGQGPEAAAPAAVTAQAQVAAPDFLPAADAVLVTPPAEPVVVAAVDAAPSYTTPVDDSATGQRFGGPLVNYVVAHSEVTTSAVRFSPLSSVMSAGQDLALGTVEMTEAEIGAHR